jgi:hypothetical protein
VREALGLDPVQHELFTPPDSGRMKSREPLA